MTYGMIQRINLPASDPWLAVLLTVLYFFFKMLPVLVSGACIFLGYRLFVLGVSGVASLSVDAKTVQGQLLNAAPGLFFAIGGIVALILVVLKGVNVDVVWAPPLSDGAPNATSSKSAEEDE